MAITQQEAWTRRDSPICVDVPIICGNSWKKLRSMRGTTSAWTSAPASASVCPSPFSKASSAAPEQRAARTREKSVVARVADLYAALPAVTGKLELEYEGELKGAETIARELIRTAIGASSPNISAT